MAVAVDQMAQLVSEYAAGHHGWKYVERDRNGLPFARRVFEFPEVSGVERVALFLTVNPHNRREPFTGEVALSYSSGPEDSTTGEAAEVTSWLAGWEQTLKLPSKLRDCGDAEEAFEVTRRAPAADVARLAYLFDVKAPGGGPRSLRLALAKKFCPAKEGGR